jgi:hypothetical protein
MPADAPTALKEKFPQATERPSADHPAFNVPLSDLLAVLKYLRDEAAFAAVHRSLSPPLDDARGGLHPDRRELRRLRDAADGAERREPLAWRQLA